MKSFVVLLTVASAMAIAEPVVKSGQLNIGYDSELNVVLTKKIQVSFSYCSEAANTLLSAHVGDGTEKNFCVTIK